MLSDELLASYLEKYKQHLLKYRSKTTALNRASIIRRYVFPFFLSQSPPLKDPQLWTSVSVRLLEHLEKSGLGFSLVREINTGLKGFYKYLIEEGIVAHGQMVSKGKTIQYITAFIGFFISQVLGPRLAVK